MKTRKKAKPLVHKSRARLNLLADLLVAEARKRDGVVLKMTSWGEVYDPDNPLSCGTQACALGLAALSGRFPGLDATISEDAHITIRFNGRASDPFNIARKVFGLTRAQSYSLFSCEGHPGLDVSNWGADQRKNARIVARNIRAFAAQR